MGNTKRDCEGCLLGYYQSIKRKMNKDLVIQTNQQGSLFDRSKYLTKNHIIYKYNTSDFLLLIRDKIDLMMKKIRRR